MISLLGALLVASVQGGAPSPMDGGELLDEVAAVVDDGPILLSEIDERAAPELKHMEEETPSPEEAAHRRADMLRQALQTLIDERLLGEQLKSANITITEQDLDDTIRDVMRSNGLSDIKVFEAALEREGMTVEGYRKKLRDQLEKTKLLRMKVNAQIKITDSEVEDEYQREYGARAGDEEVRARHILVALKKGATPEEKEHALSQAKMLERRARAGEDFGKLAHDYSDGPSSAHGGELGWFKRGEMVPEFDAAAFSLSKGEVSDPVLTQYGYHVIQLEDRRVAPPPNLAKVKEQIRQKLAQKQMAKLTSDYLEGLRKDASIEIRLPELRPRS
ncbi:MAG: peptidylprolyl isomerase [Deltaproteobacteria bacterium]